MHSDEHNIPLLCTVCCVECGQKVNDEKKGEATRKENENFP